MYVYQIGKNYAFMYKYTININIFFDKQLIFSLYISWFILLFCMKVFKYKIVDKDILFGRTQNIDF